MPSRLEKNRPKNLVSQIPMGRQPQTNAERHSEKLKRMVTKTNMWRKRKSSSGMSPTSHNEIY